MKSIDVFCHLMPPDYAKVCMEEAPHKSHMFVRALNVATMSDMNKRLEVFKSFPGYKQIPNIVSPPVETFAGPDKSPRLAALGNDEIKKIVEAHPECYEGFIAGIPFNNVQASVEEIKRVKDMGAKGIQIYTHMNGEAIDTEKYWPIYEICEKLDLPVLIHPVGGQMVPEFPSETRSTYELWFTIGWPYQTTVAMMPLAFSGVFEDFPNLKIITHHAGAMIPMLEGRIENGLKMYGSRTALKNGVVSSLFFTFFLMFFLVAIGMIVGGGIGAIFKRYGIKFVVIGVMIPVLSVEGIAVLLAFLVGYKLFKINWVILSRIQPDFFQHEVKYPEVIAAFIKRPPHFSHLFTVSQSVWNQLYDIVLEMEREYTNRGKYWELYVGADLRRMFILICRECGPESQRLRVVSDFAG